MKLLSHVRLSAIPLTVAYQAPPSMAFPRQEYWSGLPVPSPGDLPNPGMEPRSATLQAAALPALCPQGSPENPGEAQGIPYMQNLKRNDTDELIYKTETDRLRE